jgi:hypothetical protein
LKSGDIKGETGSRIVTVQDQVLSTNYLIKKIQKEDEFSTHLHYSIFKKSGIETAENWYSYIPKAVCEREGITVLWIQGVRFWLVGQTS